jgi:succinate dehydrogenase/fumarate reductase flavoprotein subunit
MAARTAVVAGTATSVSGRVARNQAAKYQQEQQLAASVTEQAAAAGVPSAVLDYAAELEQLAQLKSQGILTEEEFEAKKKQILGI